MAIDPSIFDNPAFPSGPGLDVVGGLGQFTATLLPILQLLMQQQQFAQGQQAVASQPFDPQRNYYQEVLQAVQAERQRLARTDPGRLVTFTHPETGQPVTALRREDWVNIASQVTGLDPRVLDAAYNRLQDAATSGRFGTDPNDPRIAQVFNQTLGEAARTAVPSLAREQLAEQIRQFNEQLALQQQQQQFAQQQQQANLALQLAQAQAQMAADPFARLSFQMGLTGGQAISDPVRVAEEFFNRVQSGQLGPVPGNAAPGLPGIFMPPGTFQPGQVAPGTAQPIPLPAPGQGTQPGAPLPGGGGNFLVGPGGEPRLFAAGQVTPEPMVGIGDFEQRQFAQPTTQPDLTQRPRFQEPFGVGPMLPTTGPFAQTTPSPTQRLQALAQNVTPRSLSAGFSQLTPSQRTFAMSLFRQAGRDPEDALQEIEAFRPTRQGSTQTVFSF